MPVEFSFVIVKSPVPALIVGDVTAPGSWLSAVFDAVLSPLHATLYSLLAFYIASASYRAFRARSLESSLLLGSALAVAPGAVAAVLVPLAFFGWLFAPRGLRAGALTCVVFAAIFAVIGRPDNAYWGLLDATLLFCGLAFAPRGLAATIRSILRRRPHGPPAGRTGEASAPASGASG